MPFDKRQWAPCMDAGKVDLQLNSTPVKDLYEGLKSYTYNYLEIVTFMNEQINHWK